MKKPIMDILQKIDLLNPSLRKIIAATLLVLLVSGMKTFAQDTTITVRFANERYDSIQHKYYVDVEIQSNTADLLLYGFNVRFFYEDDKLQYLNLDSLAYTYAEIGNPTFLTGNGTPWGISGPLIWVNGLVEATLEDFPPYIPTDGWLRMFQVVFGVKVPVGPCAKFCPSLIWDLEENAGPVEGGYLPGDDGVVLTVLDVNTFDRSLPSHEVVQQFNWMYDNSNGLYGHPIETNCIGDLCIPVANWPIYLAIGLMLLLSVLIYRRRL